MLKFLRGSFQEAALSHSVIPLSPQSQTRNMRTSVVRYVLGSKVVLRVGRARVYTLRLQSRECTLLKWMLFHLFPVRAPTELPEERSAISDNIFCHVEEPIGKFSPTIARVRASYH